MSSKSKHRKKEEKRIPRSKDKRKKLLAKVLTSDLDSGDVGMVLGSSLGRFLGKSASQLYAYVSGHGDYKIERNALVAGMSPPQFKNLGRGVRVAHREYVGDLLSSTGFQTTTFPLNPGMFVTFPFLSQLAQSFEEYRFLGVLAEFKTMSASALNSTNTALGTVMVGTQYNALDPVFSSKVIMENYEFSSSGVPSKSILHPIECAFMENPLNELYVRVGGVSGDLRMYDLGNVTFATTGMQAANVNLGEIWFSYIVELFKPKLLPTATTQSVGVDHFTFSSFSSANAPFTNLVSIKTNTVGGTITSTNTYTFPLGTEVGSKFMITWRVPGTSAVLWALPAITPSANLSITTSTGDAASQWSVAPATGTGVVLLSLSVCQVTAATSSAPFLTWSGGNYPGSITTCDLMVQSLGTQWS